MPILERDPWRNQFFEHASCPEDVLIPTDDPDCWLLYPEYRWIYDKLKVADSQGLSCGPHGLMPERFPVFSKPMTNLKGMGIGSRTIPSRAEMERNYQPGHMWMQLLEGAHVSTDCAVLDGTIAWFRHATGKPADGGTFDYWTIHADPLPKLDGYLAKWVEAHMAGYSGMMNFETIDNRIIEGHLRFADQWCDLYGPGWVDALVRLYAERRWDFEDNDRVDGFSIPLFGRHGATFRHPSPDAQRRVRTMPRVRSLQITFFEDKRPDQHPMPPGGFRLGIVNATDLGCGLKARHELAKSFPHEAILQQDTGTTG